MLVALIGFRVETAQESVRGEEGRYVKLHD